MTTATMILAIVIATLCSCTLAQPSGIMSPVPMPYYPGMIPTPIVYKKAKNLNEQCVDRAECKPAFSVCLNKVCTCPPGFSAVNGVCQTSTYSCPLGEPLKLNGVIRTCTRKQIEVQRPSQNFNSFNQQPQVMPGPFIDYQFVDSCGDGYMCVAESQNFVWPISITGHCCQKPKSVCPLGMPTNQRCNSMGPIYFGPFSMPDPTVCNTTTHYCLSNTFNGVDADPVCCPKACLDDEIYANGKCYSRVQLGDRCEMDAQCTSGGPCTQGVCSCRKGEVKDSSGNYCTRISCGGEISMSNSYYSSYFDWTEQNPITNANGDFINCGTAATQCGANAFCSVRYAVCCPKPKLRCPNNSIPMYMPNGMPSDQPILPESSRCVPIPTKQTCPMNYNCNLQFANLNNMGTIELSGVCCPKETYPMFPQPQTLAVGYGNAQNYSMPQGQTSFNGFGNGTNAWQNIQQSRPY